MQSVLLVAVASLTFSGLRTDAPKVLPCSVRVGCEVRLPLGVSIRRAVVLDPRFQVVVVSAGDQVEGIILILPMAYAAIDPDGAAHVLATKLVVTTNDMVRPEYTVLLRASSDSVSRSMQFLERSVVHVPHPAPIAGGYRGASTGAASTNPESFLDPMLMDFGYKIEGAWSPCSALFGYRDQIWCKLSTGIHSTPTVRSEENHVSSVVNVSMFGDEYIVISSLAVPLRLEFGGQTATIVRSRE